MPSIPEGFNDADHTLARQISVKGEIILSEKDQAISKIFIFDQKIFLKAMIKEGEPGSSVGIATRYGLEGPGIQSRWGEILRTYPDRLRGPPSLLYNGYRVFPGCKGGRGVMLTTHLVLRLRKI